MQTCHAGKGIARSGWRKAFLGVLLVFAAGANPVLAETYTQRWEGFQTELIEKQPTFQMEPELPTDHAYLKRILFPSGDMQLQALLDTRNIEDGQRLPAVVYLHGGFGLRPREVELVTQPMTDAGLIVFAPTWRGENSNPGYFECFLGEVRDARAAINWLAEQDYVDPEQIYVFGWSVGGGIALNLSMLDGLPVRFSASSAGLYDLDLIESWATEDDYIVFPYDYRDERENYFRLPLYHLQDLQRPHTTYLGSADDFALLNGIVSDLYPQGSPAFSLIELQGDHMSSLPLAVGAFLRQIED